MTENNAEKPKRGRPKKVITEDDIKKVTQYTRKMQRDIAKVNQEAIAAIKEKRKKALEALPPKEPKPAKKEKKPEKPKRVRKNDKERTAKTHEAIAKKPKVFGQVTKKGVNIDYDLVTECAALGLTHAEIASYVGMSTGGFCQRISRDEKLSEAIQKGKARGTFTASTALSDLIKEKNLGAIIFYLKARCGWSDKLDINLQGNMDHQVNLKNMSDGELLKLIGEDEDQEQS